MDPVQRFFRDLDDPTLYEKVDDLPIFGESVRMKKGTDGKFRKVKVDGDSLQEIADAVKYMEDEKGVLPIVIAGHRNLEKGACEQSQPEPWGYARNLRKGHYQTPTGKHVPTLLGTVYFRRDVQDKEGVAVNKAARTFPFRSVEYYPDSKEITAISLLRRDPELDLGMVSFGKGGSPCYMFATENVMPFQYEDDPTMPPDANVPADGDELADDEKQVADRFAKHYEKNHPAFKYMCGQYAATQGAAMPEGAGAAGDTPAVPAAPSGTSTMPDKKELAQMSRTELPAQYVREMADMKRQLKANTEETAALKQELGAERREKRLIQYRSDLERLSASGYEMDISEEMKDCEDMTPAQFERHKTRIETRYERAPVGKTGQLQFARHGWEGSNGGQTVTAKKGAPTEEESDQAIQYMREKGCADFDDALAAVRAKKTA